MSCMRFLSSMTRIAAAVALAAAALTNAGVACQLSPDAEQEPASVVDAGADVLGIAAGPVTAATIVRNAVATADWYFPPQPFAPGAGGSVIWLQRAEGDPSGFVARLATALARQTGSVVLTPRFRSLDRPAASVDGEALAGAAAELFVGPRAVLNESANAAGLDGPLPAKFLLVGIGKGGGFATAMGARTVDNGAAADLLGVVMLNGQAKIDQVPAMISKLDSLGIPDYVIVGPRPDVPSACTRMAGQLLQLHPGQFVGFQLPIREREATISTVVGWVNDMLAGNGPTDPQFGIYGNPNDGTYVPGQRVRIGRATAKVL